MKKLLGTLFMLALVVICLFLLPTEANAASESDLEFKLDSLGESYWVERCNLDACGELVIPATYNEKPVTLIENYAFAGCDKLTSIIIPDSVTGILSTTFYSCDGLTSVTIGKNVTFIGELAFACCSNLTSITIPDSVERIDDYAFEQCTNLSSVTIGNGVTSIGDRSFYFCSKLTSIVIPDSVKTIDSNAFARCESLTSVLIGNGVETIRQTAFSWCQSLGTVYLPVSLGYISADAFAHCTKLKCLLYAGTQEQLDAIFINGDWDKKSLTHLQCTYQFVDGELYYFCPECDCGYAADGRKTHYYTVTFKDWDGTVLSTRRYPWGTKVTLPEDPEKAADDYYRYTFAGWDAPIKKCLGDATYTATYSKTARPLLIAIVSAGCIVIVAAAVLTVTVVIRKKRAGNQPQSVKNGKNSS